MTIKDLMSKFIACGYMIRYEDEIELDKFGVLHIHTHTIMEEPVDYSIIIPTMEE